VSGDVIVMVDREQGLPLVVDLPTAASMLGVGRTLAYRLVRTGEWPTPLIRVGRLIKVPTGPLLELLHRAA
jgi:predicted site-specific integrase-resolvase